MPESKTPIGLVSPGIEALEIEIEEAAIGRRQQRKIVKRDLLVHLVDCRGREPELNHGTEILDEARVGRAAVGGELWVKTREFAHGPGERLVEGPGRGDEGMRRWLKTQREFKASARKRPF